MKRETIVDLITICLVLFIWLIAFLSYSRYGIIVFAIPPMAELLRPITINSLNNNLTRNDINDV